MPSRPSGLRPVAGEVQGGDELRSAVGVEEIVKGLHSFMDGRRGEAELRGDLSISQALGDGTSDPPLPVGERRTAVHTERDGGTDREAVAQDRFDAWSWGGVQESFAVDRDGPAVEVGGGDTSLA